MEIRVYLLTIQFGVLIFVHKFSLASLKKAYIKSLNSKTETLMYSEKNEELSPEMFVST